MQTTTDRKSSEEMNASRGTVDEPRQGDQMEFFHILERLKVCDSPPSRGS